MHKSRLQELCHRRSWDLPEYTTTKVGLDHRPLFRTTITVNGESFVTPVPARSSKLSQNDAAQIAFEHLSAPMGGFRADRVMAESGSGEMDKFNCFLADLEKLQPSLHDEREIPEDDATSQIAEIPEDNGTSQMVEDTVVKEIADAEHFYKNQLQTFAQKRNLALPVYICEREGPVHASRFRCKVKIDGKTYATAEYFRTTKEAEHAAAKVALSSLSESNVKDGGFLMYKNLLQEFCQKQGYAMPVYRTTRTGEVHAPTFVSFVEISEESFTEQRGPTKKMAEMNAAKVAYTILKERKASQSSTPLYSILREQSSSFSYFTPQPVSRTSNMGDAVSETAGGLATGHLSRKPQLHPETASLNKFPQNLHESIEATQSNEISTTAEDDAAMKDMLHVYKNQLQTLAQRRNLAPPTYTCEREGSRFRCKVVIDGKAYETSETFQSTKQAEHAAAKLALISMSANVSNEVQGDSIMYKNLLQEFTQKRGYPLPKYTTEVCGGTLMQTFISTVEVNGENFTGLGGRTKKLAEMNAAKVAYSVLKERTPSQAAVLKSFGHHASSSSMNRDRLIINPKDSITAEAPVLSTSPCRPKQEADMMEFQSNSHTVASGGIDAITSKSQGESERFKNPFLGGRSSSGQVSSSASLCSRTSDSSSPMTCDLTGVPPNVIRIYPRSVNMKFPVNNIVLSDENWVALSSDPANRSI